VARICTYCGKPLPRDDARFCNSCGTPARPLLKEQIAFPSSPTSRPDRPGRGAAAGAPARSNLPESAIAPVTPAPLRELRIKVWDTPGAPNAHGAPIETQGDARGNGEPTREAAASSAGTQHEIDPEDLPTSRLSVAPIPPIQVPASLQPPPVLAQRGDQGRLPHDQPYEPRQLPPDQRQLRAYREEIEQLETRPLQSQRPASPAPFPPAPAYPAQWQGQSPFPLPPQRPVPGAGGGVQSAFAVPGPAVKHPARRRGRTRAVVVLALLAALLVGGVVTWLVAFTPFSVPAVTNTTVSFQNASLGVSLRYPQGWTAQLDVQHSAAYFFDANHTDQSNLNAVANKGLSVDQYIANTTEQLGMTGQKNLSPLTFAGQSWQQVRGTVLVSGATYTETLLVTTHGDRLYALLSMAPAPTYASADRLFFAPMRSSFQFS
jgi:zinc-ribbon domain